MGQYGSDARRAAWLLLEEGLVHIGATDAHHPVEVKKYVKPAIKKLMKFDRELALDILRNNPAKILRNEQLDLLEEEEWRDDY